jgi:tetratricopeptide (TPR) repeat protein
MALGAPASANPKLPNVLPDCSGAKQLVHYAQSSNDRAVERAALLEAVRLCPNADVPRVMLGLSYENEVLSSNSNDYGKAINEYKRALAINPHNAAAQFRLGAVLYRSAAFDSSSLYLTRFLERSADDARSGRAVEAARRLLVKCQWLKLLPEGKLEAKVLRGDRDSDNAYLIVAGEFAEQAGKYAATATGERLFGPAGHLAGKLLGALATRHAKKAGERIAELQRMCGANGGFGSGMHAYQADDCKQLAIDAMPDLIARYGIDSAEVYAMLQWICIYAADIATDFRSDSKHRSLPSDACFCNGALLANPDSLARAVTKATFTSFVGGARAAGRIAICAGNILSEQRPEDALSAYHRALTLPMHESGSYSLASAACVLYSSVPPQWKARTPASRALFDSCLVDVVTYPEASGLLLMHGSERQNFARALLADVLQNANWRVAAPYLLNAAQSQTWPEAAQELSYAYEVALGICAAKSNDVGMANSHFCNAERWRSEGVREIWYVMESGELESMVNGYISKYKTDCASTVSQLLPSTQPTIATVIYDGLMWTKRDAGQEMNWESAQRYCNSCTADGYHDWRLPTIAELRTLLNEGMQSTGNVNQAHYSIRDPIELSSYTVWSSEAVAPGANVYWCAYYKGKGARIKCNTDAGVLCVRHTQ